MSTPRPCRSTSRKRMATRCWSSAWPCRRRARPELIESDRAWMPDPSPVRVVVSARVPQAFFFIQREFFATGARDARPLHHTLKVGPHCRPLLQIDAAHLGPVQYGREIGIDDGELIEGEFVRCEV